MSYMFQFCKSLKKLNLSNFKTKNVLTMCGMFHGCSSLINLDISYFSLNQVKNIKFMFSHCSTELKNKIKKEKKDLDDSAFNDLYYGQ